MLSVKRAVGRRRSDEGSREGWRGERGRKKGGLKENGNETKLQGLFESLICR